MPTIRNMPIENVRAGDSIPDHGRVKELTFDNLRIGIKVEFVNGDITYFGYTDKVTVTRPA